MRTIDRGSKLIEFHQHMTRLEVSTKGLFPPAAASLLTSASFKGLCMTLVKACIQKYREFEELDAEKRHSEGVDFRITFLLSLEKKAESSESICYLRCYLTVLPLSNSISNTNYTAVNGGCQVEISYYGHRPQPKFKDSAWMSMKPKEGKHLKETNEVLLVDPTTRVIYEGLSSNFVALRKRGDMEEEQLPGYKYLNQELPDRVIIDLFVGDLSTILLGTMLHRLIELVKRSPNFSTPDSKKILHLKIREESVILENVIDEKLSCFITSTSRGLLPIDKIVLTEDTDFDCFKAIELPSSQDPIVQKLASLLTSDLETTIIQ